MTFERMPEGKVDNDRVTSPKIDLSDYEHYLTKVARLSPANSPQVERLNPPDWHEWVKTIGVPKVNEKTSGQIQSLLNDVTPQQKQYPMNELTPTQKHSIEEIVKLLNREKPEQSGAKPEQCGAKPESDQLNQIHFYSRPVYGLDLDKTKDAVENYGSNLDYRGKSALEKLVSESTLGKTKEFGESLHEATSKVRKAFADFLKKEADCYVELKQDADGSYSFNAYPKGSAERLQFSFRKDGEHSFGQPMASAAWLNGKAPMGMDPWVSSTDSKSVDSAFHLLSEGLSKYLVEIGQSR